MTRLGMIGALGALLAVRPAPVPPTGPNAPPIFMTPGQSGSRMQVNFPPASHSQVSRDTYWLKASEPLQIDVQLSVDPGRGDEGVPIEGALMVDAVQVRMTVGDARGAFSFRRVVTPGKVDRFSLAVPAERIPRGVHSCVLIAWEANGRPFPGWGFAIVKGTAASEPPPKPQTFSVRPWDGRDEMSLRVLGPHEAMMFGPALDTGPAADGGASFSAHVALAPRAEDRLHTGFTLVALLDGRQVPLAGAVLSPTVTLAPGQSADTVVALRRLPSISGHRLLIFLFAEETPPGADVPAPWMALPPRQMGGLRW